MKFYNKQGFENKRIKLGNGGYWVQQKINNIHWTTIDYGSEKTLQEKINQWFN
jgi:hypothetical protein